MQMSGDVCAHKNIHVHAFTPQDLPLLASRPSFTNFQILQSFQIQTSRSADLQNSRFPELQLTGTPDLGLWKSGDLELWSLGVLEF